MENNLNNNEMNNNYNNTPNYNYEKKNSGVKVLLIIVIILAIAILGLLSYKLFVVDKKSGNNKEDNNNVVESKVDNSKISSKLENELKSQVLRLPLNVILDNNYDYKYIYESNAIFTSLDKISYENNCEFNKDKVNYNGFADVSCYRGSDVVDKVKELYNYNLILSDKEYGGCNVYSLNNVCKTMYYDKDIDKFVVINGSGTASIALNTILDSSFDNSIYKVKFVNAEFNNVGDGSNCYLAVDKENKEHTLCTEKEINEYNTSHKDELSQYEVSFKINSDDTYEFVDINKIN